MSPGTGVAKLSTGAADWMPEQKASMPSAERSSTAWMMSLRASPADGTQRKPSPSKRFEANTAPFSAEAVTVGALEKAIRKGARGLLKEVALFDIYRGKGIDEGKKSVAFNLVLRADDRSLTSEEADEDVKSILEALEKDCGAKLR